MVSTHIPRPRVACEVTAERVIAARSPDKGQILESVTAVSLAEGAVAPGLQQANVASRETLVSAFAKRSGGGCRTLARRHPGDS